MAAVNMELAGQVAAAEGLRHEDKALVRELMDTWRTHRIPQHVAGGLLPRTRRQSKT